MNDTHYHEITGCIHIHSTYSDGSGSIAEIARAAEDVGLNYIIITDHNNLRALQNEEDGWYGKVLVCIGYEINDVDNANHYLALGLSEEVPRHLSAPEYVRAVKQAGGVGIIAHPDERRDVMPEHPPYPWTAWNINDYQGIEIWNQMSEWMEGLKPWNQLWRFIHPRRSVEGPNLRTLKRWDEANLHRRVVGIGGVDAHAHKHRLMGGLFQVTVFPYKVLFKTIRTHLLLSHPLKPGEKKHQSQEQIYQALRQARAFVSNYALGDARGFTMKAINQQGIAHIGEQLPFSEPTNMVVQLPVRARMRLIHNGRPTAEREGKRAEFDIEEPGIYRMEVYRKGRIWIISNHIRIENDGDKLD